MKERNSPWRKASSDESDRTHDNSNVIYIREYLERHPATVRNIGRRAVRNTTRMYHGADARIYEMFPVILEGESPELA